MGKTERGFRRSDFEDYYGASCSIQESSLAPSGDQQWCLWLGCNNNQKHPDGTEISPRMHLTQKMAEEMAEVLQYFADTGELPDK